MRKYLVTDKVICIHNRTITHLGKKYYLKCGLLIELS